MSGRRIDDHSFWAGGMSAESVLPKESKVKQESGVDGVGDLGRYEDTAEAIRGQQRSNKEKARSKPMKPGFRN